MSKKLRPQKEPLSHRGTSYAQTVSISVATLIIIGFLALVCTHVIPNSAHYISTFGPIIQPVFGEK
jgi:hypothetical protein